MANWASSNERFVEVPGVVEIRWESDDPDYYVKPTDLFDQQAKNEGLPDWYGKKDKATTEQAFFTCNVCECDLKSVVTLRAHCKGTQHIRKALQKKKEYRDAQKLLKKKDEKSEEASTEDCKTLFSCLEKTSEPVVGLANITEYRSRSDPNATPFYHCNLDGCYDDQGDCKQMMEHIMVARHKQSWLRARTGSAPQFSSEVSQKIAEFTKDYQRDYTLIMEVTDDEKWKKCKRGTIRTPREEREERRSWGEEERLTREKEERRSRGKEERRSWEREEHKGGRSRMRDDREERRSWKREGTYDNESDSKRRRSGSREAPCRTHQDVPTSVEAAIKSLQRKVATCVKTRLERYYDGLPDTLPENRKLNDPEEYRKLAKHFSHKMRDSIQESYELYHRTMEGITLTLHDKDQINMEIDVFFEDKKVIEDSSTSSDDN